MGALARILDRKAVAGAPVMTGSETPKPEPVTFTLPSPPSTNGLFKNVPGRGRVPTGKYLDWQAQALTAIALQKVKPLAGRVIILVGVERHSMQADIDNRLKATLDVIVKAGVIEDDTMVTFAPPFWMPKSNNLAHVAIYPCQRMTLTFHPSHDGASGALVVNAPQSNEGEDDGYQPV